MRVSGIGGLPVVDKDNKIIGLVTRTDLLDHLVRMLQPVPPSDS
jgi:predicted transcriptional regulator